MCPGPAFAFAVLHSILNTSIYRTMHFSAERGLVIA